MVDVPGDTRLMKPSEAVGKIVATARLLLLQVPPVVVLLSTSIPPVHPAIAPVMGATAGEPFTVTTRVDAVLPHALVTVYDISEVPASKPLTSPPVLTVATVGVVLLHTPDAVAQLNVTDPPTHTVVVPVRGNTVGSGTTVTVYKAYPKPQVLEIP
jgi:hypothetical protein